MLNTMALICSPARHSPMCHLLHQSPSPLSTHHHPGPAGSSSHTPWCRSHQMIYQWAESVLQKLSHHLHGQNAGAQMMGYCELFFPTVLVGIDILQKMLTIGSTTCVLFMANARVARGMHM